VRNLVVEVDAKYIQGMLNSPELVQNTVVGRWAEEILSYPFKLCHVCAASHAAPNSLSRRRRAPEDTDSDESGREQPGESQMVAACRLDGWVGAESEFWTGNASVAEDWEPELDEVREWLRGMTRPSGVAPDEAQRLAKRSKGFFLVEGRLWRRRIDGQHQLVMPKRGRAEAVQRP
jgi:hypothetical protein